jgi:tRNA nucleotidyltransferase (CCA-adding enzyme)
MIEWGIGRADPKLAGRALRVIGRELWLGVAEPAEVLLEAGQVRAGRFRAREAHQRARELATVRPLHPSEGVAAARGRRGVELVIARALGAAWLDDYIREWRHVRLAISGHDLLDAGVEEGPDIGRGLAAALRAKLDGDVDGRDAELETALRAASVH